MLQTTRHLGLVFESLPMIGIVGDLVLQPLQRDLTAKLPVLGEEHVADPARGVEPVDDEPDPGPSGGLGESNASRNGLPLLHRNGRLESVSRPGRLEGQDLPHLVRDA